MVLAIPANYWLSGQDYCKIRRSILASQQYNSVWVFSFNIHPLSCPFQSYILKGRILYLFSS